jgi:Icc-related predicted phosphoesterase
LCFTGHIHEGIGIDRIGRTVIVNPGPFRSGHYAYAEINVTPARADITEIRLIN